MKPWRLLDIPIVLPKSTQYMYNYVNIYIYIIYLYIIYIVLYI